MSLDFMKIQGATQVKSQSPLTAAACDQGAHESSLPCVTCHPAGGGSPVVAVIAVPHPLPPAPRRREDRCPRPPDLAAPRRRLAVDPSTAGRASTIAPTHRNARLNQPPPAPAPAVPDFACPRTPPTAPQTHHLAISTTRTIRRTANRPATNRRNPDAGRYRKIRASWLAASTCCS